MCPPVNDKPPISRGRLNPWSTSTLGNQLIRDLIHSRSPGQETALLVVRISDYRELAETFGGDFEEEFTRMVGSRLRASLRFGDKVSRIGDDEYAVVPGQLENLEDVNRVAQRLAENCSGAYALDGLNAQVKSQVGVALYPSDAEDPADLLRFARIALRRADASNTSDCCFFSQDLLKQQQHKVWMAAELERAFTEERFTLHYQPQYDIDSQRIFGMEALVRMVSDTGELIPPNDFIPIAEENGFIIQLGEWVIHEACRQFSLWRKAGCAPLRIAVNVSPKQLVDDRLIDIVSNAVNEFSLSYRDLELEITEQCVLEYSDSVENTLEELHRRGVRIAVDDFGTGYSSFAYLARLPLDVIKMDRSFLVNVTSDVRAGRVVVATIAMAGALGSEIIAEGVETQAQEDFLRSSGCMLGQGYGFSRPQNSEAMEKLLVESSRNQVTELLSYDFPETKLSAMC